MDRISFSSFKRSARLLGAGALLLCALALLLLHARAGEGTHYAQMPGTKVSRQGAVTMDYSNASEGYVAVKHAATSKKLKVSGVLTQGVTLIGTIVLYGIALSGAVAMKDYMSFNAAYGTLGGAFGALASVATVFARIEPVMEMARPILEAEPETAAEKKVLTTLSGSIEMQNVTFRYEEGGPKIIDNLSLNIHSGEYVAIAGPSGCGKSTLVRLLLGFEKPEQGSIFYDRRSIDQIDLKSLRQRR